MPVQATARPEIEDMTMAAVVCCNYIAEIAVRGAEVWGIWGNRVEEIAEAGVEDPKTAIVGTAPQPERHEN